jgi:hypothetical protein
MRRDQWMKNEGQKRRMTCHQTLQARIGLFDAYVLFQWKPLFEKLRMKKKDPMTRWDESHKRMMTELVMVVYGRRLESLCVCLKFEGEIGGVCVCVWWVRVDQKCRSVGC